MKYLLMALMLVGLQGNLGAQGADQDALLKLVAAAEIQTFFDYLDADEGRA